MAHPPPSKNWMPVLLGLPLLLSPLTVSCQTLETRGQPGALPQSTNVARGLPTRDDLPLAPNGRHYPVVPTQPREIADLIALVETAAVDPNITSESVAVLAHQQQVIYRALSRDPSMSRAVRNQLSPQWHWVFDHHIAARREFLAMHRGPASSLLPAWRIQAPASADELLNAYRSASSATGIDWEVLAAVNLVETGMGRIDGVSVANAQGPMQFLPTTWTEPGIGQGGDIRDPWDSIHAAARYLVRRGGLDDIRKGLWGYNNSDHYGKAVLHYAALLKQHPLRYRSLHQWQIHYASSAGDLWLNEGYASDQPIAVEDYLEQHPHSAPPNP
ncbi:lytic transglycosylase domain-containing protein [Synechococcus sp. A15-60]|uniref:lytic transglycosylase domain-containing protein n=1 Tax=Synechococcus sp. A15-60 TaxID=1050655 RepID=UPI0021040113|nr:lytic transglycosylase domain-containing protein [Synechococcus sp. A15-60]